MYKHTLMPPYSNRIIYIRVWSPEACHILQNNGTFFYVVHMQHLVAKPSIASRNVSQ